MDKVIQDQNQANIDLKISEYSNKILDVKNEISKIIVGQNDLIDSLLIWLFWKGHILLEWVPWLAKTLTVNTLGKTLDLGFNRVQFTPDLLPSDLVWTEIYNPKNSAFDIKKWPIFNNFILADEINRAPSKVQSALLESMAEKHITIWNHTFDLEKPFIVLATQNPIEQSGTYNLPEAQLDRFMLKVNVFYPSYEEEKEMYKRINSWSKIKINQILSKNDIFEIQKFIDDIYVSDSIYEFVTNIVDATRYPEKYNLYDLKKYIQFWVSPRWGLSLISWAKVVALMNSRNYVIPEDIKFLAHKALNHRLVLSYEAVADDITSDYIIDNILKNIEVI